MRQISWFLCVFACLGPAAVAQKPQRSYQAPADVEWIRDVEYGKASEKSLKLDILRPKSPPEGLMPAIVFIHGGGFVNGDKEQGLRSGERFARTGYFFVTINYRLLADGPFPAAVEDCKAVVRWLRAKATEYGIDPERIGVWGTSAGGHLAAFTAVSGGVEEFEGKSGYEGFSSRVTCAVDGFGPADFTAITEHRAALGQNSRGESGWVGGDFKRFPDKALRASPIHYVSDDDPPLLIVHGMDDPVVPYQQSVEFEKALRAASVDVALISVRGAGHGYRSKAADQWVDAFFAKHLKGEDQEIPSTTVDNDVPADGQRPARPQGGGR